MIFCCKNKVTTLISTLSLHDALPIWRFRIDGVTGPDEYSALEDNNAYTNLLARDNMRWAAAAAERHPTEAETLGVTADEDRKSTRLNSSHSQISYAVFCLKKKTKKTI